MRTAQKMFFHKNGQIGELKKVYVESCSMKKGAKNGWFVKWALVNDKGQWLVSKHWDLNRLKTAIREITEIFGYTQIV